MSWRMPSITQITAPEKGIWYEFVDSQEVAA